MIDLVYIYILFFPLLFLFLLLFLLCVYIDAEKRLLESLDLDENYSRALTWYIAYLLHYELYDEFMNYINEKLDNRNSTKSIGYINILTVINYLNSTQTVSVYENLLKYTPLNEVHRDFIPYIMCFIQIENYPSYFVYYYILILHYLYYSSLSFSYIFLSISLIFNFYFYLFIYRMNILNGSRSHYYHLFIPI